MSGQETKISLESLKTLVAEALSYKVMEDQLSWSLADAKRLYEMMPIVRGYCGRIEKILHQIETARGQIRVKVRDVQFRIQSIEDEYVQKNVLSLTSKGLSWEERASYRRVASFESRRELKEYENSLEVVDFFHDAVERHYRNLLQCKQDVQTMLKLLQVGSILGDVQ